MRQLSLDVKDLQQAMASVQSGNFRAGQEPHSVKPMMRAFTAANATLDVDKQKPVVDREMRYLQPVMSEMANTLAVARSCYQPDEKAHSQKIWRKPSPPQRKSLVQQIVAESKAGYAPPQPPAPEPGAKFAFRFTEESTKPKDLFADDGEVEAAAVQAHANQQAATQAATVAGFARQWNIKPPTIAKLAGGNTEAAFIKFLDLASRLDEWWVDAGMTDHQRLTSIRNYLQEDSEIYNTYQLTRSSNPKLGSDAMIRVLAKTVGQGHLDETGARMAFDATKQLIDESFSTYVSRVLSRARILLLFTENSALKIDDLMIRQLTKGIYDSTARALAKTIKPAVQAVGGSIVDFTKQLREVVGSKLDGPESAAADMATPPSPDRSAKNRARNQERMMAAAAVVDDPRDYMADEVDYHFQSETAMAYDGANIVNAMEMAAVTTQTGSGTQPVGLRDEDMVPPFGDPKPWPFAFCQNCRTRGHFDHKCPQYSKEQRAQEAKLYYDRMAANREKRQANWRGRGGGQGQGRGFQQRTDFQPYPQHQTMLPQQYVAPAQFMPMHPFPSYPPYAPPAPVVAQATETNVKEAAKKDKKTKDSSGSAKVSAAEKQTN
jgi:hypothetical protein